MLSISEMRVAIDTATEGGLYALNAVCKNDRTLEPNIWVEKDPMTPGYSRVLFYATSKRDRTIEYFNSVLTPTDENLEEQLRVWVRMREVKKTTAQILKGLERLEMGLDPEEFDEPSPSGAMLN